MILFWFLAVNFALTVLYLITKKFNREEFGVAFFFIFLPGLGFLLYFLIGLFQSFLKTVGVDREAVLTHALEIDLQPQHPDIREALNIVPVEDAIAVSENAEKRALLLKQLKKNLQENYKVILAAEQDEDSESAHYVAAAKMEIYRLQQTHWLECRRDYEQDPENPDKYHRVCTTLTEMLDSGVLSAREQNVYRRRLCDIVLNQIFLCESEVLQSEFEAYLRSLVELGCYEEAELLWKKYADRMPSESAYQNMLKMFYLMGKRQSFEDTLNALLENQQVQFSAEGLEQFNYWLDRLNSAENKV